MATNFQVCDICPKLAEEMKKFQFRKEKNVAAIVMKVNKDTLTVEKDESTELDEDMSIEDLQNELPASQPRFVLLSYVHRTHDGRELYPLIFIFVSPKGCKPELTMMYTGTQQALVKRSEATRVYEVREIEELTEELIKSKLPA